MNLSPQERAVGQSNFNTALNETRSEFLTRREFLAASAIAAAVPTAGLGTFYFGYSRVENPVRVGIIGTGDEGSVLIHNLNPEYLDVVAIADIRPYSQFRAFHGDANNLSARQGLMRVYGWNSEDAAHEHVKVFQDYKDLLALPEIEAVIIAVPLFIHKQIAIDALRAGKHVLTEKLMGHSIGHCKEMARASNETNLLLATGHQRHYSVLYDNAVHTIRQGLIGKIHHIRAQWHRGNLPGRDSWQPKLPADLQRNLIDARRDLANTNVVRSSSELEGLQQRIALLEEQVKDQTLNDTPEGRALLEGSGYRAFELGGTQFSALEELIRWRLWNRTGGGLMAELGSHQLDASSIFLSAFLPEGQKVRPLTVSGVGGRHLFRQDRDCDDHVYVTFEFPATPYTLGAENQRFAGYAEDPNKKVVVTYSSINGNGFGGYGEVVLGTEGTLILDAEREAMLFLNSATTETNIRVSRNPAGGAVASAYETAGGPAAAVSTNAMGSSPPSRGYREEMEHWAWCIRNRAPENKPRCHPEVAMADAVLALTANYAMRLGRKIEFHPDWFDINNPRTPEEDLNLNRAV